MKYLAADQFGEDACFARSSLPTLTMPSVDRELVGGNAELLRRHLDQHAARLGGGHAHLLATELDAGRAGCAALVHAGARCRP